MQLAAALGSERLRAERLVGELSRLVEPPSLESLLAAAENAPRVEHSQDEVALHRASLQLELRRDLALAYEQVVSAYHEARALEEEVVPAAGDALDHATWAYARREVGFLDLMDAQRNFFRARAGRLEALERYHYAIVEVGELVDADIGPNL